MTSTQSERIDMASLGMVALTTHLRTGSGALSIEALDDPDEFPLYAADLIADVLHLAHAQGYDTDEIVEKGRGYFEEGIESHVQLPDGFSPDYSLERSNGVTVRVEKAGVGAVGPAYEGKWTYWVTFRGAAITNVCDFRSSAPMTHHEVACLVADFFTPEG